MRFFRYIPVLLAMAVMWGCAASSSTLASNYIGSVDGRYATVFYRVDDTELSIVLQNTTVYPMTNLVIGVSQRTVSGEVERQSSTRLLRMRDTFSMTLPVAPGSTGEVTVRYFFRPGDVGIGISPFGSTITNTDVEDVVSFRVILPK